MDGWLHYTLLSEKCQRVQRGRLTGLRPEGCGRLSAAGYVRFAQGVTAPTALKVADCRSAVHSEHILKER